MLDKLEEKYKLKDSCDSLRKTRKGFIKKTNIPIPVYDNSKGEFTYFLDLYDKLFNAREEYERYLKTSKRGSVGRQELLNTIIKDVKSSEVYSTLNNLDMTQSKINFINENKIELRNSLLKTYNHNKRFISLDIKQADYNTFKSLDKTQLFKEDTYEEWVSKYVTNSETNISNLRNVLFGNLNPKRIKKVQKETMISILEYLKVNSGLDMGEGFSVILVGSDEVILEFTEEWYSYLSKHLTKIEDSINFPLKLEVYDLKYLGLEELGYVKEMIQVKEDNKGNLKYTKEELDIEFKGTNKVYFAQAYKHYFGLEITEEDLVFSFDNRTAQFYQPLEVEDKYKLN